MADEFLIKHLRVVDSTNNYAREAAEALWAEAGGHDRIVAVIADLQTAGRGQRGNSWHSLPGENLLLTMLVRPRFLAPKRQFLLSQAVALAVSDTLRECGIEASLKWPNDIYVADKKLAGILVELDYEADYISQAIIGVGLNVNQTQFPPLERRPVSMRLLTNRRFEVTSVAERLLRSFRRRYSMIALRPEALCREYKRSLIGWNEPMKYTDASGSFVARIEDVEPDGHLLLRRDDATLSRYAFKEVELCL